MPRKTWSYLLFAVMLNGAAQAETIVVAATGAGDLVPGSHIEEGQSLSLPDGARLTLLTQDGEMKVIMGPYEGAPISGAPKVSEKDKDADWSAVLALIGDPDARSDILGASRATDGALLAPPSIWHVSIDSSGPRCIGPEQVSLWRRRSGQEKTVSVRSSAGRLTDLSWPKNAQELQLPGEFAINGKLVVSIDGDLRDLTLTVAPKPLLASSPGAVFSWLMENKCQRQALTLIERVHAGLGVADQ